MPLKTISQRKFLKGLIATQPKWEQSPGGVPRLSNLLLSDRGGLRRADGSLFISQLNGVLVPGSGPWTEIFLFQPANSNRYYIGIRKDPSTHLGVPVPVASDAGAGGVLAAGTYRYKVTTLDGAGGETTASAETSVTILINHLISVVWPAIPNAGNGGYKIYRTAVNGAINTETLLATLGTGNTTYQDNGSAAPDGVTVPPAVDSTQVCQFYKIPATSYGVGNIITTFPADPFVPVDGTPGGSGGGGGTGGGGTSAGAPPNPTGGNTGNISPIPQIVQFANKAVLALGNGFAPQLFTDPSTVAAITNTFTAAYPNWVAATVFSTGSKLMPTAGNAGNFIFTASQGGTTGGGAPVWPQTANQVVNDNNIIWQNTGATNTAPAPRGAAHAEVYAGSLWVANTNPTTTADNFDGPTCLKMSDLNNPTSWNPINTAFLGKDDGDQVTGLKAFTIAADGISPTGSLLVFKYFKTFQVVGVFGSPNFAIQEARTDMGCIASRSIQFLPGFGICRLTHLGIAIFDGTNDRLISEEIRPYIFPSAEIGSDILTLDQNFAYLSKAAQSANPPMYMLAVPLALANLALTGATGVTLTTSVGSGTWAANFYYVRVVKVTSQGEVALTTETKFDFSVTTTNRISFTPPATVDPTALSYRVYIGTSVGTYSNFATVLPTAGATLFANLGAFPTAGSINSGVGGLTRVFCYDLVLKAWAIIDLPFAISVLKQVRAPGTIPITICGGFNDGSVRRLQSGDTTFDGTPISWSMRSAEVFGKITNSRIYYRRLTVRGTTTQTALAITATVNLDGADGVSSPMIVYQLGNVSGTYDFLAQIDIGFTNYTSHVTLSGNGDIEITALDWEATTLREGVPPVI